jgi:hypothetical protein
MRDNGYGWTYNGYAFAGGYVEHNAPSTPEPSDTESLTKALSRTNPNRPTIDLPVFVYELKDIPDLLKYYAEVGFKQFKDRPIQEIGGLFLQHEYGVKAFMRDMLKMFDFQKAMETRLRQFKNLRDGKSGLHRTATVWRDESENGAFLAYLTPLYQESNLVIVQSKTTRRKWVSTRWSPSEDFSHLSDEELLSICARVMFGVNGLSFATLWEAMPWSWLIDWFSTVGDVIAANRNEIGASFGESCIMKSTESGVKAILAPWNDYKSARLKVNSKASVIYTRLPTGTLEPSIDFSMPFLSANQLSILSALGAQRI